MNNPLVIFDGDCGFCHWSATWLAKTDRKKQLRFTASTSSTAKRYLDFFGIEKLPDETIVFISEGNYFVKSKAIFQILKTIDRFALLRLLLRIFPKKISDFGYDIIASHRKKLMQKKCLIPSPEIRHQFIED